MLRQQELSDDEVVSCRWEAGGREEGSVVLKLTQAMAWLAVLPLPPYLSPLATADTDSAWRVRDKALALAASDSGSYFLAEHFHIHEAELRHLHRQLQPPAPPSPPPPPPFVSAQPSSLSSFSLSQLDFQHFYASKMLRCLLKMLVAEWGVGGVKGGG